MNKLIKKIETPTDFSICIFQSQKTGRFAVTTYDIVSQKHEDAQWYATKEEAMAEAKDRAKGYRMNESKQTIRLNESDLYHIIKEALDELNWKSYANAAKKRLQQSRETDEPEKQKELWDKYYELAKAANQSFDDEFVGNWKYDTMGAKLKGKHSPRFSASLPLSKSDRMPYGAINGYNKGGDKIFSTDKGTYHAAGGIVSPGRFFRDADVASAFKKANDELWDYDAGKYRYEKGKGWIKGEDDEEKLDEAIDRALKKLLK